MRQNIVVNIIAGTLVALIMAAIIVLAIGAQYACTHWFAPWMLDSHDATAIAFYCRPGK
jgi:hypothetical protein